MEYFIVSCNDGSSGEAAVGYKMLAERATYKLMPQNHIVELQHPRVSWSPMLASEDPPLQLQPKLQCLPRQRSRCLLRLSALHLAFGGNAASCQPASAMANTFGVEVHTGVKGPCGPANFLALLVASTTWHLPTITFGLLGLRFFARRTKS